VSTRVRSRRRGAEAERGRRGARRGLRGWGRGCSMGNMRVDLEALAECEPAKVGPGDSRRGSSEPDADEIRLADTAPRLVQEM
jgi:hypothetical protein